MPRLCGSTQITGTLTPHTMLFMILPNNNQIKDFQRSDLAVCLHITAKNQENTEVLINLTGDEMNLKTS
jgi:hypothetical protein